MTTIYADFNAMTEDYSISMTTRGSARDIEKFGVHSGDWVWLSDGELQVGARIVEDDNRQLVALPEWDTAVDYYTGEVNYEYLLQAHREFQKLIKMPPGHSPEVERQILELSFQFEHAAPRDLLNMRPGYFAYRRAIALYFLGRLELALIEVDAALASLPDASNFAFLYLDLLRRTNPIKAVEEAERLASMSEASAVILVSAINILASHAEDLPDDQFAPIARRTLDFYERFERSPGRGQVTASLLSLVHFNRGLVLLRLGQTELARAALELAHAIDPYDLTLDEATELVSYGQRAREIAARVRAKPLAA